MKNKYETRMTNKRKHLMTELVD